MSSADRCRVLFCDDLKSERQSFLRRVAGPLEDRLVCETAASHAGVVRRIEAGERYDILITDLNFDQIGGGTKEGLQILKTAKEAWPELEVVIFTAYPNSLLPEEVLDASAIGLSLDTWVTKISDDPADSWERMREVIRALLKAIEERRLRAAQDDLTLQDAIGRWAGRGPRELGDADRCPGYPPLIGRSGAMRRLYRQLASVGPTDTAVLIYGEPGAGKELVARALHALSTRRRAQFLAINCSELDEQLLASELFGHKRGAFTGAVADREGLFSAASGGTFFLDEVGELTLSNQAAFLRVLESGEVRPVGAERPVQVDVRLVAATNQNLSALKTAGHFRADLLARLNRYFVYVPPLRVRRSDIPLLAVGCLERLGPEYGRPGVALTEDALWLLSSHSWPGNVRELASTLTRSLIDLPPGQDQIDAAAIALESSAPAAAAPEALLERVLAGDLRLPLSRLAKTYGLPAACQLVEQTMRHFEGLPPEAEAQRLFGMSYRNWQHWAHYHGLTWEKVRARPG